MQSKVTIVPDDLGNVIRVSKNNSEYGHVRLTQESVAFTANGWVKKSQRSTLIHGTVEDLTDIGIAQQTSLPGQIVIKESTDAFNSADPDRDLKIAGETGVICCAHGEPIYRKAFYDASGLDVDEFVAHTNGDAIREAQAETAQVDEAPAKGKGKKKKVEVKQEISAAQLAEIQNSIKEEEEEVEEEDDELVEEVEDETFDL